MGGKFDDTYDQVNLCLTYEEEEEKEEEEVEKGSNTHQMDGYLDRQFEVCDICLFLDIIWRFFWPYMTTTNDNVREAKKKKKEKMGGSCAGYFGLIVYNTRVVIIRQRMYMYLSNSRKAFVFCCWRHLYCV